MVIGDGGPGILPGEEEAAIVQGGQMAGALGGEPEKTLQDARFVIGDYVSCAILPPMDNGGVAPHLQGLQEVVSVLEGEILAEVEGGAWGQERMGMVGSEDGVVQEGVVTLVKALSRLENGEEERDYQKDLEGVEVMVEADLAAEAEADIEEFCGNDTTSKIHTSPF